MVVISSPALEEVLEAGQRVVAQVDRRHPRDDADAEQPERIPIATQKIAPTGRDPQHDSEPEGQDQSVEGASEDQQLDGSRLGDQEDNGRDHDEAADDPAFPAGDPRTEHLQERRGRVRGADDGRDGGRPHDDAEDDFAGRAQRVLEGRAGRVELVELPASGDHTEDRQEQQHPHQAGDHDASDRASGDLGNELLTPDPVVSSRCAPAYTMYPPTVPPMRVVMTRKLTVSGATVWRSASPTGGRVLTATNVVSAIITTPRSTTTRSMATPARRTRKMAMATADEIAAPTRTSSPNIASRPSAVPATLPMLKTRPPSTSRAAST